MFCLNKSSSRGNSPKVENLNFGSLITGLFRSSSKDLVSKGQTRDGSLEPTQEKQSARAETNIRNNSIKQEEKQPTTRVNSSSTHKQMKQEEKPTPRNDSSNSTKLRQNTFKFDDKPANPSAERAPYNASYNYQQNTFTKPQIESTLKSGIMSPLGINTKSQVNPPTYLNIYSPRMKDSAPTGRLNQYIDETRTPVQTKTIENQYVVYSTIKTGEKNTNRPQMTIPTSTNAQKQETKSQTLPTQMCSPKSYQNGETTQPKPQSQSSRDIDQPKNNSQYSGLQFQSKGVNGSKQNTSKDIVLSPRPSGQILESVRTRHLSPPVMVRPVTVDYYVQEVYQAVTLSKSSKGLTTQQSEFLKHITQSFEQLKIIKSMKNKLDGGKQEKFYNGYPQKFDLSKKTVILDLDETLIHSMPDGGSGGSFVMRTRPFAMEVLRELKKSFNLAIFTASHRRYSEQIVKRLDPQQSLFNAVLYRENCYELRPRQLVKDISLLGLDMSQVVIVDNMTSAFTLNLLNGIPILPFYEDNQDTQLRKLLNFLQQEILPAADVRVVIDRKFKFQELPNYRDMYLGVQMLYGGEQN